MFTCRKLKRKMLKSPYFAIFAIGLFFSILFIVLTIWIKNIEQSQLTKREALEAARFADIIDRQYRNLQAGGTND